MSTVAATRGRLLEAAIIEFSENGFDNATVRNICARADVNLNAVKYHFGDKQGLYVAAVKYAHAAANQFQPTPPDLDAAPSEQLRSFVRQLMAIALSQEQESVAHQLLIIREMVNPTRATEEIVRSFVKPRFAQLNAILAELLPPGTSTLDRHLLALSVVGQCLHYRIGRKVDQMVISRSEYRRLTLPRLTDHVTEVTLAAIDAKWRARVEDPVG